MLAVPLLHLRNQQLQFVETVNCLEESVNVKIACCNENFAYFGFGSNVTMLSAKHDEFEIICESEFACDVCFVAGDPFGFLFVTDINGFLHLFLHGKLVVSKKFFGQ